MSKTTTHASILSVLFLLATAVVGHAAHAGDTAVGLRSCEFSVGISRSDMGGGTWKYISFTGPATSALSFQGCTTSSTAGQQCISTYGVAEGVRVLTDQNGRAVGDGVCCNDVTNAITSITAQCSDQPSRPRLR